MCYEMEDHMTESVYKVIELIGASPVSWERAATVAVETAASSLMDLRKAEVIELDMVIEGGKVVLYRAKLNVSFKYHQDGE
jgi:flavin-binding protein dodecin